ncbi:Gfo/Idh/MocA family oxidoreductase [Paenibacillus mesophilus]|uniref:Gfo/Idh/MocA family protein n=1 Tax=Paenibacillus mesophilus TaxID=2582849 RepID=UPI00110E7918|nr:Gfo/Idh/MocA family oxidoreductase [Paenibacillus mesophilus]TMV51446.1 Gfo/Idh/MocA family oxidoreductase [Paenibacillus mesophilus]
MEPMQVAVIGFGTMGKLFARHLSAMEGVRLTAVSSTSPAAEAEAEKLGARWFANGELLLERCGRLDAVVLALPTHLHEPYAVMAARKGIHVICEKPVALSTAEADRMAEACEQSGVHLYAGHVLRFFPEYANLLKHAQAGAIGKIGVAHAKRFSLHPPSGSWFADESKSGGVVFDLMIHDIDFMRSVLGEVHTVFASVRKAPGVQYATATLRFDSGAIANLEAMWGYPGPFATSVEFAGQNGILRADNASSRSITVHRALTETTGTEGVEIPQSPMYKDPYRLELEHFIGCIRTGTNPIVTVGDARRAVEIACAALESANTGQPVKLTIADPNGSKEGGVA